MSPGGGQGPWLAAKNARDWPIRTVDLVLCTETVATLSSGLLALPTAHCPRMPVHGPRDPRDPEPVGLPITHLSTQTFVATLLLPSTPNGSLGREDPVSDDRPRYTPSLTLHPSPSRFFHHCTSIHHTQLISDLDHYSCLSVLLILCLFNRLLVTVQSTALIAA